ncbi:MAG: plasmid stabilization protein [Verrucomicrobiaceae bacterium]|nr:plasmid stabilization protein [Verrucomicrobiaceae bacterium]
MAEVTFSPDSLNDLRDIWDYVAEESPLQADRLIDRFRQKIEYLAEWNTLGRPRPELTKDCRSYPFGKYCFYYRPKDTGIELLRVLHSARDIRQMEFGI